MLCSELLIGSNRAKVYFFDFFELIADEFYFFICVRSEAAVPLIQFKKINQFLLGVADEYLWRNQVLTDSFMGIYLGYHTELQCREE